MTQELQHIVNERQAAKYLGISEGTLRLWRSLGKAPRHFKAGEKMVRYLRSDLDLWIEGRLNSTGAEVRQ